MVSASMVGPAQGSAPASLYTSRGFPGSIAESGLSHTKDADHRVSQRRKGGTSDNCMAAPVAAFAPGWTLASR